MKYENNELTANNKELPSQNFQGFEQYLNSFGLPSDNVIASEEERQAIQKALPDLLNSMSDESKKDARYLSKFIAGTAVGLFDAALNFVWNEVVLVLRKRVIAYGLDYFFEVAVGASIRDQYRDEESLVEIKDKVLLDNCKKLGIISDILYKKLSHILDMRNNIGASHPTTDDINSFELLGWLKTCIDSVINDPVTDNALQVKKFVDNIRTATAEISNDDIVFTEETLKKMGSQSIYNIVSPLFGMFVDNRNKDNNVLKVNVLNYGIVAWKYLGDDDRYKLGEKIDAYRSAVETYKVKQAELFFERCNGKRYYSSDHRLIQLSQKCEQLKQVHNSWDNFINEIPVAREIMSLAPELSDIPDMRKELLVETFLLCRIGNGVYYNEGVSQGAKIYYDSFFKKFNDEFVKIALKKLSDGNLNLSGEYRSKQVKEICSLMKNSLLSESYSDILDKIIKASNVESFFKTSDFNRFKENVLN